VKYEAMLENGMPIKSDKGVEFNVSDGKYISSIKQLFLDTGLVCD
jgi:hypothetical protein